jgi:hypothetical protein
MRPDPPPQIRRVARPPGTSTPDTRAPWMKTARPPAMPRVADPSRTSGQFVRAALAWIYSLAGVALAPLLPALILRDAPSPSVSWNPDASVSVAEVPGSSPLQRARRAHRSGRACSLATQCPASCSWPRSPEPSLSGRSSAGGSDGRRWPGRSSWRRSCSVASPSLGGARLVHVRSRLRPARRARPLGRLIAKSRARASRP